MIKENPDPGFELWGGQRKEKETKETKKSSPPKGIKRKRAETNQRTKTVKVRESMIPKDGNVFCKGGSDMLENTGIDQKQGPMWGK